MNCSAPWVLLWMWMLVCAGANVSVGQGAYYIHHDTISARGWFGGDNVTPRNVGTGQGVRIDSSIVLTKFSFHFGAGFDYRQNPEGKGHEVTLKLNIRDPTGTTLQTQSVVVPETFSEGWVTWSDISMAVQGPVLLIFTAYLVGGYDLNPYTSSQSCDASMLYLPGEYYIKEGISDADMESWTDWAPHLSWDAAFRLEGVSQTTDVDVGTISIPTTFELQQNYPNPFNPTSEIRYQISEFGHVRLAVYDLLGREVVALVNEWKAPGHYAAMFDATGLASGVYLYRMTAGSSASTRKMVVQK